MAPNPYVKQYLMTAGPTPVPPAVSQAMATPMLYHRAPAFVELYERVLAKLPKVFQTENDVLTFAASGSGAMDCAAANLSAPARRCSPAPPASSASAGSSSPRPTAPTWSRYEPGWGERLDPQEIGRLAEGVEVVFATLSETSTGIVNDIQAIAEAVNADARSSSSTPSPASAPPSSGRTSGASTSSSPAARRR